MEGIKKKIRIIVAIILLITTSILVYYLLLIMEPWYELDWLRSLERLYLSIEEAFPQQFTMLKIEDEILVSQLSPIVEFLVRLVFIELIVIIFLSYNRVKYIQPTFNLSKLKPMGVLLVDQQNELEIPSNNIYDKKLKI